VSSLLTSFVVAPTVMLLACAGLGVLVARACGGWVPWIYVLPLGFGAVMIVSALVTTFEITATFAPVVVAAIGAVGLALELRLNKLPRPGREAIWPALAGLGAFAAVAAPVVLSGEVGFSGYASIVDIAHHFDLTTFIQENGRVKPAVADSSNEQVVRGLLNSGYPSGWQASLGSFARLLGTDPVWLYQPLMGLSLGMLALALFGLLSSLVRWRPFVAVAALVAAQANILYGYGLVGGFKEMAGAGMLVLTTALLTHSSAAARPWMRVAAASVAALAGFLSFSLAIVPWLAVIVAGLAAVTLRPHHLRAAVSGLRFTPRVAVAGLVVLVLSAPVVLQAIKLAPVAARAESGSATSRSAIADLGNLATPMPEKAAAGVWISGDYRFSVNGDTTQTNLLIALVLLLALIGLVSCIRRREWALPLLLAATGVALAYFTWRTGPWIQLKSIAISGPLVLAGAFVGAARLGEAVTARPRLPPRLAPAVPVALATLIATGVLYGNAKAYHSAALSPTDRLKELARLGERYEGRGPVLVPPFEEYSEYFLRNVQPVSLVNPPFANVPKLRGGIPPRRFQAPYSRDPDEFRLAYLQRFPLLLLRRGPDISRPPSNWRLDAQTEHYEVWRRARPAGRVLTHVSLWRDAPVLRTDRLCRNIVGGLRSAAGATGRIAYARSPTIAEASLGISDHPTNWIPTGKLSINVGNGPGKLKTTIDAPGAGRYQVWMAGAVGRKLTVAVDGKRLGQLTNRLNYPGQWEPLGATTLTPGRHTVRLERGGASLRPGDGWVDGQGVGPIAFVRDGPSRERVETAPIGAANRVCGSDLELDWIEAVGPRR